MKIISEFVDGPVLPVPDNLKNLVASVADCGLTPREMAYCYGALRDLGEYVKTHPLPPSIGCCILFSDKDEITLAEEEECLLGEALSLAVIQLGRIRRAGPGYEKWLRFVLLEEVCHILYAVRNEYRVKEIVAEVLSLSPSTRVDLHDYFPDHFDSDGHRIPLPEYPLEWVRESAGGSLAPAVSSRLPKEHREGASLDAPGVCLSRGTEIPADSPVDETGGTPGVCLSKSANAGTSPEGTSDPTVPGICKSVDHLTSTPVKPDPASAAPSVIPGVCKTSMNAIQKSGVSQEPSKPAILPGVCRSTLNKAMLPKDTSGRPSAPRNLATMPGVCRTIVPSLLKTGKKRNP